MKLDCVFPTKLTYSIREACDATSLSRSAIYCYIAKGRLRVVRLGGRTLIPAEALSELLAAND